MKTVIGIVGSPRKGGNTTVLVQAALDGAAAMGAQTRMIHVNDLQVRGCQACEQCKTTGKCATRDDMDAVYAAVEGADAVIFASPIYMGTVTAQLKLALDRMYRYLNHDFSSTLPPGKRAVFLFTQGNPDAAVYAGHFRTLHDMLHPVGFNNDLDTFLAVGQHVPGAVAKDETLMNAARELGKKLVE